MQLNDSARTSAIRVWILPYFRRSYSSATSTVVL